MLYSGFMSAHVVVAAEKAADVPLLFNAETTELQDALDAKVPPDKALAPRPVAITLLAFGSESSSCVSARTYLDALAHLSVQTSTTPWASKARMTVFAGVDASWFVGQVKDEVVTCQPPTTDEGFVYLCARWALPTRNEKGRPIMRSEFVPLEPGLSLDASLERIQNSLMKIKVAYSIPICDSIVAHYPNVAPDAWAASVHTQSKVFVSLMEGAPCVHKSKMLAAAHDGDVTIENASIFVRICPRRRYCSTSRQWVDFPVHEAILAEDSFHGFLAGNDAYLREIANFCKMHERVGLPLPTDETSRFCLHTIAAQATGFPLESRISLYGTTSAAGGHKPGVAIASPGSWIWRFDSAIVNLENVLQNFFVVPCSRDSLLPGNRMLERPFAEFFNLTFKLFVETFGKQSAEERSQDDVGQLPLSIPANSNLDKEAENNQVLAAFGVDLSSRRLCVGDAYTELKARGAPKELSEFMLNSTLRLGLSASVVDAVAVAGQALLSLSRGTEHEIREREMHRLKRIADGALGVATPKRRLLTPPTKMHTSRVKALLQASGLRKGADSWVPEAGSAKNWKDYSPLVSALGTAVLGEQVDEASVHQHACEAALAASKHGALSVICATVCVLRSTPHKPATCYVVAQQTDENNSENNSILSLARVLPNGGFEQASPGKIIDNCSSRVLLLQITGKGDAARVTGTVRV